MNRRQIRLKMCFALVLSGLGGCGVSSHVWRSDAEVHVWQGGKRCQEATAYRSQDFNFLLVMIPEAKRGYLLDLEHRHVGVPAYETDIKIVNHSALVRQVPPRSVEVGTAKLEGTVRWVDERTGERFVEITASETPAVRIYYYR